MTDGGNEGDTLSIVDNQYVKLNGTIVTYDADGGGSGLAVQIGTLTNSNYNTLTVTLNADANDAAVAALTQAIEFSNSKEAPVAGERTVTLNSRTAEAARSTARSSLHMSTSGPTSPPS